MRYLSIVILALLIAGLFAGCVGKEINEQPPIDSSPATGNVAAEAGSAVDDAIIDDTDEVEIGEMI